MLALFSRNAPALKEVIVRGQIRSREEKLIGVCEFKCPPQLRLFDIGGDGSLGKVKLAQARRLGGKLTVVDDGEEGKFTRIYLIK